ncbi:MerR family transcriptional regulator [Planotetraspora mira]|jgi:DNA-binding transcriptional MerR regulator|nr:MerR family transcriptional regulator [Planotetraspora mira]
MGAQPSNRGADPVGEMTRAALRPVDLARAAGVSTQQIRNYADTGILPPTGRTSAGYRVFDARHRDALLTYRALAKGYGWDAARSIMLALHSGDLPRALALVDACHAVLHEQRLSLQATGEALEAVAGQASDASAAPYSGMRIGEVAAHLGVRTSALRVWEAAGLLTPRREAGTGYRRYDPADVRDARMVGMLRQGQYRLAQIGAVLEGLRRTGSSEALRAAIADRRAALTRTAAAMLEGAGHLNRYVTDHTGAQAQVTAG